MGSLSKLALIMGITLASSNVYSQERGESCPQPDALAEILGDQPVNASPLDHILNPNSSGIEVNFYLPETGDIIVQHSTSQQSRFIEEATGSPYTHMGLVVVKPEGPYVLEAVGPVKYTKLSTWVNRGYEGKYSVVRVNPTFSIDYSLVVKVAESFLGKPYDSLFMPNDTKIYCSELVQKAFEEGGIALGEWQDFGTFLNDSSPQLKSEIKKRWGKIPSAVKVVTPVSIVNSPFVDVVYTDFKQ